MGPSVRIVGTRVRKSNSKVDWSVGRATLGPLCIFETDAEFPRGNAFISLSDSLPMSPFLRRTLRDTTPDEVCEGATTDFSKGGTVPVSDFPCMRSSTVSASQ